VVNNFEIIDTQAKLLIHEIVSRCRKSSALHSVKSSYFEMVSVPIKVGDRVKLTQPGPATTPESKKFIGTVKDIKKYPQGLWADVIWDHEPTVIYPVFIGGLRLAKNV
jgi:hypothetical protein